MRCTHCGHELTGNIGDRCPACGHVVHEPSGPGGPSPWETPQAGAGAPREPSGEGIPWENEHSAAALIQTIKVVLLETSRTFAQASTTESIGSAFGYAMLLGSIGGLAGTGWQFLIGRAGPLDILKNLPPEFGEYGKLLENFTSPSIFALVAIPMALVIGLFVWAGIVHVSLTMVGGASSGFEATFRSIAYAQGSTALLQIVPVVGGLVAAVWNLLITILAVKELHKTTTGKAVAGVLLPMGVLLLCCCCVPIVALVVWMGSASSP